ncbi:ammonium transporter [Colletotrichum graminicola]|uniref:Ammonium transporter n=1 Tax=Colletotrichum graminicola (strain M1.001 / M2 / FGSC 10212) TaxID=645133 RepID=E3Q523_COLGM|nr:ammonium transporter [Colletotrichum graminicola M1.001]EFQ25790.1 ammonium transporter [Colletotrichum graminicola M1.001]WDK22895.1 ammonium transporter [Colletotrichum graminicola]
MSAGLYALPYNGTEGRADAGYSSGVQDLNVFYESGDLAWIMVCAALVLLMIPGVGFFYSGLARRKSALSLILMSMICVGVVGFQWFFWGYTLTFSHTGSVFLGDMSNFGLRDVVAQPSVGSSKIPDILFCLYQGMFAAITPALALGAIADRGRILPAMVFAFIWATIVYDPIAYWTWNSKGWLFILGSLDFAGGTPVHISSGAAALAYSLMLGKRTGYNKVHGLPYRPHNVTHVVLGTVFLWVGWFGFNGGSALASNLRAVMACFNTNLAAGVGGVTWMLLDYRLEKKWSTIGFCSGAIAGLVAITPGAGFVTPWASVIFGIVGGSVCNFGTKLKFVLGIDDGLDIFAVHGIGGIAGNILTGIFAASYITALDGAYTGENAIAGGWIEHHYVQLGYQLAGSVAGFTWSFVLTCLILFLMNFIPGLSLRVNVDDEDLGLDDCQLGEFAYDYVEVTRHVSDISPNSHDGVPGSCADSSLPEKTV